MKGCPSHQIKLSPTVESRRVKRTSNLNEALQSDLNDITEQLRVAMEENFKMKMIIKKTVETEKQLEKMKEQKELMAKNDEQDKNCQKGKDRYNCLRCCFQSESISAQRSYACQQAKLQMWPMQLCLWQHNKYQCSCEVNAWTQGDEVNNSGVNEDGGEDDRVKGELVINTAESNLVDRQNKIVEKVLDKTWSNDKWNLGPIIPGQQLSNLTTSGQQIPGLQLPGLQVPGLQHPGLQTPVLQHPGLQHTGRLHPGLQHPGLQIPGPAIPWETW